MPSDTSLDIADYVQRGVAPPGKEWSQEDYVRSLLSLEGIGRAQLPRAGSSRSGVLFERLLATHLSIPDVVPRSAGAPSLADLYSVDAEDGLLFDRELVAIRGAELKALLSDAPTRSEIERMTEAMISLRARDGSREAPGDLAAEIEANRRVLRQSSHAIRSSTGRLMLLATIPELSERARTEWISRLTELTPLVTSRLIRDDRQSLGVELKSLSAMNGNRPLREELMALSAKFVADQ